MGKKDLETKNEKYKVSSRITFQLNKEDEENKIIEFLNAQDNISKALKEVLKFYISHNEIKNITTSSKNKFFPGQKELEEAVVEVLFKAETDTPLSEIYDIVAEKFQLSESALQLRSEKTNDNVFQKKVRFVILRLKNKGVLDNSTERGFVRMKPFLRQFSIDQIINLDSIVEAIELNVRIKESNI